MKEELKDRLRKAMDSNGIKAIELCEKTGVPKSAISYYLAGKSEPKSDRLYIIAKALDVSEAWLLGYNVDMERDRSQKELDELADLNERIKKEKDFRQLILKINRLKPQQLEAVKNLLEAFPQD